MRRWRRSEAVRVWVSASAIVRDWASVRVWVMVTWGSVGHGDVRVRESARRERVGESRRRVGNALFSVTPLTRSVSGECVGVWRMSMPMRFGDALLRERRRRESRMRSAGRTRFQLTPDSASGVRVEREICTARRCRCRCGAGVCQRRRSAAHLHRCVCPRRCRGLTEGETARAVRLRLWSSGVPPARRQQGRVKTRHAALRCAYRVTAECRRSATMSADVGGECRG